MGKIRIIIGREYLTGVRNKAFIILCFAVPLFFAAILIVPTWLASQPGETRKIVVCDNSGCPDTVGYAYVFQDTMNLTFDYGMVYKPISEVREFYGDSDNVSIFYIPENFMGGCDTTGAYGVGMECKLYSKLEPGFNTLNYLENAITTQVQQDILAMNGLSPRVMELSKRKVSVGNVVNDRVSSSELQVAVGFIFGMAIYIYILLFGVRVMKSVQEEKSSRIVEIIVSSIKPFQLMMGKIIAVALVALTQFTVWVILSLIIVLPVMSAINEKRLDFNKLQENSSVTTAMSADADGSSPFNIQVNEDTVNIMDKIMSIPWGNLIPAFVFYFIFGYLLYASIFAAAGAAADSETDTAQFTVPVTVPLIISIASFAVIINNPNGTVAKWLSMIPFTSPITMMMRIPFGGVYLWELLLSMTILIVSFIGMTWLAGRVYRTGILMYGKKTSWKEIGKWLFYKG